MLNNKKVKTQSCVAAAGDGDYAYDKNADNADPEHYRDGCGDEHVV